MKICEVTYGDSGCTLTEAEFFCEIELTGPLQITQTSLFYISTSIEYYPSDNAWVAVINSILSQIEEISEFDVDLLNNLITIQSTCSTGTDNPLAGVSLSLTLSIEFDVECAYRFIITPSVTPSYTVTMTVTPTNTITPSITPEPLKKPVYIQSVCDDSIIEVRVLQSIALNKFINYNGTCYEIVGNGSNNDRVC